MKKIGVMAVLFIALCMMSGCLQDVPLTDSEMDVVAEYAARALLGTLPSNTMLEYEPLLPKEVVAPTPTPTPTPEVTPEPTNGASRPTGSGSTSRLTPTPIPDNSEATNEQFTEVIGVEGVAFSYTEGSYQLVPSVEKGDHLYLNPKQGRQYLIASFTATNTTNESIALDTIEKKLKCEVDINNGKISRASISILENDLQYMNGDLTVSAGGSIEVVLIFEISATEEINTAHIRIVNQEDEVVIIKLK